VVDDQVGADQRALADAGAALPAPRADPPPGGSSTSCAGEVSWCGFARAIVDRLDAVSQALGAPPPAHRPRVTPIRTEDYPTPAARPRNSVLDNGRLARGFGLALPHWEVALNALLAGGGERPAA
jgi:dTDP-4-dehydrorhamnose reductase